MYFWFEGMTDLSKETFVLSVCLPIVAYSRRNDGRTQDDTKILQVS